MERSTNEQTGHITAGLNSIIFVLLDIFSKILLKIDNTAESHVFIYMYKQIFVTIRGIFNEYFSFRKLYSFRKRRRERLQTSNEQKVHFLGTKSVDTLLTS